MLRVLLHQQGELNAENDKLRLLIQRLTRQQFGRRSEQLTADQLQFGLEDLEQTIAENQAGQDAAEPTAPSKPADIKRPARNHRALPAHLPRYEVVIDAAPEACPCCGGTMHSIGELRTEQLDMVPAQLRVRVTRRPRPRYACRGCEGAVVVAEPPARPIDGGMATEALIVHLLISRFSELLTTVSAVADARPSGNCDRPLDVGQLGGPRLLVADASLRSGGQHSVVGQQAVRRRYHTTCLDPGRGRTKTGRLWCYAVDDRPWCGPSHPIAAYVYSKDRRGAHPTRHLARFDGVLQVDGYAGFKRLAGDRADKSVQLAFCWAHMRRAFFEFHTSTKSPIAAELLARVAALYAIEAEVHGHPAEHRQHVRDKRSRPIVEGLHRWLGEQLPRISGASDLAKAMRYAFRHWPGLIAFLEDGRIEMDTNVVERAIRPITLARKNALFAGSDGGVRHWAIAMTLIQTAKLNGLEPMAWLTDMLERMVSGHTKSHRLYELLPWHWTGSTPTVILSRAA